MFSLPHSMLVRRFRSAVGLREIPRDSAAIRISEPDRMVGVVGEEVHRPYGNPLLDAARSHCHPSDQI